MQMVIFLHCKIESRGRDMDYKRDKKQDTRKDERKEYEINP